MKAARRWSCNLKIYRHDQHRELKIGTSWQRSDLVARVFQDPMAGTCESLTIEENMALAWKRGASRGLRFSLNRQLREQFREKLSILNLGLENRLSDHMGLLSGGQRQAVSLLMASLQPSRILLLDEHTAALDPKTAAFILALTSETIDRAQIYDAASSILQQKLAQTEGVGQVTVGGGAPPAVRIDVNPTRLNSLGLGLEDVRTALTSANANRPKGEKIDDDKLLLG